MKTILITGGTDGIGKGIAMNLLKKGHRVIVVGSSLEKGEKLYKAAKQIAMADEARLIFLQANLSLISENKRIIEAVQKKYITLDALILCAQNQKYSTTYKETVEGFEFSFSLYYLSRYILSYGLKSCLEKAETPRIINVCAPGMKGTVNWDDLQLRNKYNSIKAIMHGSRLNDLLGVSFNECDEVGKIKYILYNPGAVRTNGATNSYEQPILKFIVKLTYKFIGKSVEDAIKPLLELYEKPLLSTLTAYKQKNEVSLTIETFNKSNAKRLSILTEEKIILSKAVV